MRRVELYPELRRAHADVLARFPMNASFDIDSGTGQGWAALREAIAEHNPEAVKMLLNQVKLITMEAKTRWVRIPWPRECRMKSVPIEITLFSFIER